MELINEVNKMGKQKKYKRMSVNLGEPGNPARVLTEDYIKNFKKYQFSKLVRKLLIIYFQKGND